MVLMVQPSSGCLLRRLQWQTLLVVPQLLHPAAPVAEAVDLQGARATTVGFPQARAVRRETQAPQRLAQVGEPLALQVLPRALNALY